ncbi:MAG: hypothetical protein B6I20_05205 [Bacteroidetes bacterium 4572_117]|nr:MAG: hypothetical protein B6I20_05205 [Bacteroidetes bacterium 4572_117]
MRKLNFILSFVSIAFFVVSCGSANEAEKFGTEFHEYFKARDYENMVSMISEKGLNATPKEEWIGLFKNVNEKAGDLKSYKKTNFHTSINNGITKVVLSYDIEIGENKFYEKIYFEKHGETYKINMYEFNKDKSKLSE